MQEKNTIYIFIDASNVWNAVKSVKKFIEYPILKTYFKEKFNSDKVEVFYYDAYPLALVNYLKNRGKKVFIFSTEGNISHELKTGGNGYFDLKDINELWGKDLKHRADV